MDKKIGVACDHAGFQLKELLVGYLDTLGFEVFDFGTHSEESVDYPDTAHPLAGAIQSGELRRGITMCGSGNGINMTVNRHPGVRGALCWEPEIARLARAHNDANVCSLPARFVDGTEAMAIVDAFLNTPFEGGRHQARVDKIEIRA